MSTEILEKDKLDLLADHVQELKALEERKKMIEDSLKDIEKQINIVSREEIPSILNETGLSEIKLKTGEKVIIKDQLKASISADNKDKAFVDMIDAEMTEENINQKMATALVSEMFKTSLLITVNSEEEKMSVANKLITLKIPFELSRNIHWQTLVKWCKLRLEKGSSIPESISTYQYQETVIK